MLDKTREASAMTPRSSYDDYVIHSMQMAAYGATNNYPATAEAIESIIDSQYLPAPTNPQLLRTLMSIYYSAEGLRQGHRTTGSARARRAIPVEALADHRAGLLPER